MVCFKDVSTEDLNIKGEFLTMKKTLRIAVATLALTAGTLHVPNLNAVAFENTGSTVITNQWRKRTIEEVQTSVSESVATGGQHYIVQWGDTLGTISNATGFSVADLALINQISNPDLIMAGSSLYFDAVNQTLTYTEPSGEEVEVSVADEVVAETPEAVNAGYLIDPVEEWEFIETIEEPALEETELVEEPVIEEVETPIVTEEVLAADQAAADQAAADQAAAEEETVATDTTGYGTAITVEATAYSRNQPELGNFTADGTDLRNETAVIAVDPSVIPLGSTVYIPGFGYYRAADTGGAIVGNKIDVHMESIDSVYQFGRQSMTVYIVD